jgi:ABC-type multidrug transport system ATPase subunit
MLEITGLSKTYPNGVQALNDVNLSVPRGMFGLLGPNGAGKSSLMRTIATLQQPDQGSITLDGLDVLADPMALRRTLGYLPQEFGAYPRTSPEVMLGHLATLKGIPSGDRKTLVEQLLTQTNLWDVRKKSIDTFSGGMKQRFGIAQALIGEPSLIIVDEPTAGLDPVERRRFHNLLTRISADVVVLLSTHIVEDVADLCPHMAIMGDGQILVDGQPSELVSKLSGRLWSKTVPLDEAPVLRRSLPVVSTRLVSGEMEIRVVAEEAPEGGLSAVEPTLEDVYFATLLGHGLSVELD